MSKIRNSKQTGGQLWVDDLALPDILMFDAGALDKFLSFDSEYMATSFSLDLDLLDRFFEPFLNQLKNEPFFDLPIIHEQAIK